MEYFFAPMEGITSAPFRRVHRRMFPQADCYYAPFIAPDGSGKFKIGLLRDVLPENNPGIELVPQLLINKAEPFIGVAQLLSELGYKEVNLNIGCPSATVVAKHKGSGMLADLEALESCLDSIFSHCPIKVSVKTRLGLFSSQEFPDILSIYNQYPISRLIIHVRDRAGMYKSQPEPEAFSYAESNSKLPLCYNGNVFTVPDLGKAQNAKSVMLGRGAAANPALFRQMKGGAPLERKELEEYHAALMDESMASGLDGHCTMARLKELWFYMQCLFPGSEKAMKQIFKSQRMSDYTCAVASLFAGSEFSPLAGFNK